MVDTTYNSGKCLADEYLGVSTYRRGSGKVLSEDCFGDIILGNVICGIVYLLLRVLIRTVL